MGPDGAVNIGRNGGIAKAENRVAGSPRALMGGTGPAMPHVDTSS
jgi:hypothetical protein